MKVGDYVRTKSGIICKIESKNYTGYSDWLIDTLYYNDDEIIDDWTCGIKEYDVIKSGPIIIDLIEIGDYVNGEKVIRLFNPTFLSMGELPYVITDKNKYEPQEIENVVTKEQFENIKYIVESDRQ